MSDICHLIVGERGAENLSAAIKLCEEMQGEVIVLKDDLSVGPLRKAEGEGFSELRSRFWQEVTEGDRGLFRVGDMEAVLELSKKMYQSEELVVWMWIAPDVQDVCAYYWALPYLSKHAGRFYVVNSTNLPFLDEEGKLFYPDNFAAVLPKELVKARKLARPVTPSEAETDLDEWTRLVTENGGIREKLSPKKLQSLPAEHYDGELLSICSSQYQKLSKLMQQVQKKKLPIPEVLVVHRLKALCELEQLDLQGSFARPKDAEIRLKTTG